MDYQQEATGGLNMTTEKENEINKKLYDISNAATFIRHNVAKAKLAETPEEREKIYQNILKDALFIEGLATSVNGGYFEQ